MAIQAGGLATGQSGITGSDQLRANFANENESKRYKSQLCLTTSIT